MIEPIPSSSAAGFLAVNYVALVCLNASQIFRFFLTSQVLHKRITDKDVDFPLNFRKSWNVFLLLFHLIAGCLFVLGLAKSAYCVTALLSYFQINVQRRSHGYNTGDYLLTIHMVWLSAVLLFANEQSRLDLVLFLTACLWLMVYVVAGLCKMSQGWLNGDALLRVMSSYQFGNQTLLGFLKKHPVVTRWLQRLVIAQLTIPFILFFAPNVLAYGALIAAGIFHLCNWRVMGLPSFAAAYASFVPSMVYTIQYF